MKRVTTGLLDATSRDWSRPVIDGLQLSRGLLPPLRQPGERLGELRDDVLTQTGLTGPVPLIAVGSHDTASAVVGVPATSDRFGYISCGTWSLVGVELEKPVLTEESRAAQGLPADLPDLLAVAARVPAFTAIVDADDPRFLPPGDMPARIAQACADTGQTPPQSPGETVRCILDSLALAYRGRAALPADAGRRTRLARGRAAGAPVTRPALRFECRGGA